MSRGNNGNFGGERNKSVQRDRSLRTTSVVSISKYRLFHSSPLLPFPPSIRTPSRKRSCFYFALGIWIFRYRRTESMPLPPPSVLPSSVEPPRRDERAIFDKLLDKRDAERDQLSPSSPTHSRQLFAVFDLDIPHPPVDTETVSIIHRTW